MKELRADIVVVGSGIGGVSSALSALDRGARVLVLEKQAEPGGTTRLSGGAVFCYRDEQSFHQRAPQGDHQLQSTVVRGLSDATAWLFRLGVESGSLSEMGFPMSADGDPELVEGHPVTATRVDVPSLYQTFESRIGRDLLLGAGMRALQTDRSGRVRGVLADSDRGPVSVACDAVVLATGGFGANSEMLQRYISGWADDLYPRNSGTVTGDGIASATAIGAATSAGFGSFYGHCMPAAPAKFSQRELLRYTQQYGPLGIALNMSGLRYTDEGESALEETMCLDTAKQPRASAFYVIDSEQYRRYLAREGHFVSQGVDKIALAKDAGGIVLSDATLDGLCEQLAAYGVPAATSRREIADFNHSASLGKTNKLPVPKSNFASPLATPPYLAVMVTAGVTATHGGLRVDSDGRVLARSGHVIPGLFAAGVDVGNVSNRGYGGSWSVGLVLGRAAGAAAAGLARGARAS